MKIYVQFASMIGNPKPMILAGNGACPIIFTSLEEVEKERKSGVGEDFTTRKDLKFFTFEKEVTEEEFNEIKSLPNIIIK